MTTFVKDQNSWLELIEILEKTRIVSSEILSLPKILISLIISDKAIVVFKKKNINKIEYLRQFLIILII